MLRYFLCTRWLACRVLSCLVLGLTAASVHAQTSFPAKPVRLVVPFSAGGAADITGRILAEKLTEIWKQQVIVDNRPGAGGSIGIEAMYKAPADGYTLVVIANSHAVNVGLYDKLPYDLIADLAPITLIANASLALAAHPKLPANTLPELVRLLRDNPGKYTYGSCGNGTVHHLAMELFKFQTKTFVVHVPYRGCSPATVDAVGGQVDLILVALGNALPHIKAGRLKAMALTNGIRTPVAPEIQTMHEAGVPELANYEVGNWQALAAPAGTPLEVIAKIGADSKRVLALPDVRQRMSGAGADAVSSTPEEQLNLLKADIAKFKRIIEFAGIRPG